MADQRSGPTTAGTGGTRANNTAGARPENSALQDALAAEHTAVWGYAAVGAALPPGARKPVDSARAVHRDLRDRVSALLDARGVHPVQAKAAYALPFPVLSARDAAALAAVLEAGVATAWVWVLDQAVARSTRELAVGVLGGTEVRAVAWRTQAGHTPVTSAFPGLPSS